MSIELGTAVRDITPPPGLPMGGYAARTQPAAATLDPLACRVAVFRRDDKSVALIALDLLYVRDPWAASVRRVVAESLGTDVEAVMLAATHTHAGPAVFRSAMIEGEALTTYERWLAGEVHNAVMEAQRSLRSIQLRFGSARVDGVAANRQEQGRSFDDEVRVLAAQAAGGEIVSVIASFGCHPTVLSAANLAYSRDLFGAAVKTVEAESDAFVILFNGAAADVSTRFTRTAQTPDEVHRLGQRLAAAISSALRGARPIAGEQIDARMIDVALAPRRLPSSEEARGEVRAAADRVDASRGRVSAAELRRLSAQLEGAVAQLYFAEHGGVGTLLGSLPAQAALQSIQLGGCRVLGVPGEMFSEVGREICRCGSQPTLLVGYANDYVGYLVPPGAAPGYESLMSFVTEESAAAVAAALTDAVR